jgi:DNA polymerase-3 subunit epsilon
MEEINLKEFVKILKASDKYRVLEKYQKPTHYHINEEDQNHTPKLIGIFLDVETTGLDYKRDKIIELGIVSFEYSVDGRIFRILDEFNGYQDPGIPIPPEIAQLTGISDDMVCGQNINISEVEQYINKANLIISHNIGFDRAFLETMFPSLPQKPWACLMNGINWKSEAIESSKLEYIAYKCGFFYEGHRAGIDCLAGIHVLTQTLPKSQNLVFSTLLANSRKITFKIWAFGAPYAQKDILKRRGYKWSQTKSDKSQAWSIELEKDQVKDELEYLRSDIYGHHISLPIEIIDAYTRFSTINTVADTEKYKDYLAWIKTI